MAEKLDASQDRCQSSDSGRDSPTDLRLRPDLLAGDSGNEASSDSDTTMEARRGLVASPTNSAESVESQLSQRRLASTSSTDQRLSQHAFSDTDIPATVVLSMRRSASSQSVNNARRPPPATSGHVGSDPLLSQHPVSTTSSSDLFSQRITSGREMASRNNFRVARAESLSQFPSSDKPSSLPEEFRDNWFSRHPKSGSERVDDVSHSRATSLSQYPYVSSDTPSLSANRGTYSGDVEQAGPAAAAGTDHGASRNYPQDARLPAAKEDTVIPRLELGSSDDDGTADTGLPYSEGEFSNRTSGTTDRQPLDQLSPDSQIGYLAGDISREALNKGTTEMEQEENVREAIAQVSNEFVSGELGYLRHSMIESETESGGEERKLPSVYHICEPWSDQEVPDAWSTSSSKEVTPREVKNAAVNFKASLLETAPVTPGLRRLLTSASARDDDGAQTSANSSIAFTKTPGPVLRPLDHSTPYVTRRELDNESLAQIVPDVGYETPQGASGRAPAQGASGRAPARVNVTAADKLSTDKQAVDVDNTMTLKSPDRARSPMERTSPPGLAADQRTQVSRTTPSPSTVQEPETEIYESSSRDTVVGSIRKNPASKRSDTEDEYQFQDLPYGAATASEDERYSSVTQSSYRRLPELTAQREGATPEIRISDDYENPSARSVDDSLGDTICREIEDFLVLHDQAKMLRTDAEGEYSEDSVARKVTDLILRCERDRMSDRSTVVGSVVSDDLSERYDSDEDKEDHLAERVRNLLEKVAHSDEELDEQNPDDSLAKRIRVLLEKTSQSIDPSPRASPGSINRLIHSISIHKSNVDHDVHQELEEIQDSWERRRNAKYQSASPASQAESRLSAGTVQSKSDDDYDKKRLAWDYGADIGERDLPQFVASVKYSDDELRSSDRRARSVSPLRDLNDSYRVDLPAKSTSLMRVDRYDISVASLRDDRSSLTQRVFSLLQRDSPQQQAYNILAEAEAQERALEKRSAQAPHRYDADSGHIKFYGQHKSSESLHSVKGNVVSPRSLKSGHSSDRLTSTHPLDSSSMPYFGESSMRSSAERRLNVLRRPVSSPSLLNSPSRYRLSSDDRLTVEHLSPSKRPSDPDRVNLDLTHSGSRSQLSPGKRLSDPDRFNLDLTPGSRSTASKVSSSTFSPLANKPFGASNTAENFLSSQLRRANERRFETTPVKSPNTDLLTDNVLFSKTRPSILQRFMHKQAVTGADAGADDTNHEASRELSGIANEPVGSAARHDLVRLRRVMQHRDISSSLDTGTSMDDTTLESTHTGSDDAQGPSFPSFVYGTRSNTSALHKVGVYGQKGDGLFLIYPRPGEISARSDFSHASSSSRKRAWEEEQMEDITTDPERMIHDTDGGKEDEQSNKVSDESRRAPRRSLQILQEILEKESDNEASSLNLDGVWERYQERKKHLAPSSDDIKRLLRDMATAETKLELGSSGEQKTDSLPGSFKLDTANSWEVKSNSWKFEELNPNFKFKNWQEWKECQDVEESDRRCNVIQTNGNSPDSDKTITNSASSSTNTDTELRHRMVGLLEQPDSLISIPEEKDSGREEDTLHSSYDSARDPRLAKLHSKIREQREKYLKERRREQKRKEKIDKLEKILDTKSRGRETMTDTSSGSTTQESFSTATSTLTSALSSANEEEGHVTCSHGAADNSDSSYCPCKYGRDLSPKRQSAKQPQVMKSEKVKPKPKPVYMEFDKPEVPRISHRSSKEKRDQAIQTKERKKSKENGRREKVSKRIERLVTEGTQTSPSLLRAIENQEKPERVARQQQRSRSKSPEKVRSRGVPADERVPSRSYSPDRHTAKQKKKPKGNVGGMCWFISLDDQQQRWSREPISRSAPRRQPWNPNAVYRQKENEDPLADVEVVSGAKFYLTKDVDYGHPVHDDKITLQDAFAMFKQTFISRSRQRQKRVRLVGQQRRMEMAYENQRQALFLLKRRLQPNPEAHPLSDIWYKPRKRYFTLREMKELTEKVYKRLPEVQQKVDLKKRESEYKTNRMRAEIYKRKQLQRVLVKA